MTLDTGRPQRKRHLDTAFSRSVEAYIELRAAGMTKEKAYVTAGLPEGDQKVGIIRMLDARTDIAKRIVRKAVQNVNMIDLTEDSLRALQKFVSGEPLLVTCRNCGKEQELEIPLDLNLKGAVEALKIVGRTDILTLRERARLEDDPDSREDLARKVLEQKRQAQLPSTEKVIEADAIPRG